jgi:hypothetical protein
LLAPRRFNSDEGLQICVAWDFVPVDIPLGVARSRCKQRVAAFAVFKASGGDGACGCSFPLLLPFWCTSQTPVDDGQSKEEDDHRVLQCNLNFPLYMNKIENEAKKSWTMRVFSELLEMLQGRRNNDCEARPTQQTVQR